MLSVSSCTVSNYGPAYQRVSTFVFLIIHSLFMQRYIIWCRRTNDPDALWADMPYARRSKQECEELVRYYEEHWGGMYIYEVLPVRCYPPGPREPVFV